MPKRPKYEKKMFESTGSSNDVSANIYYSMMTSLAYQELTPKQRDLYTHCKLQYYRISAKQRPEAEDQTQFYFNKYLWHGTYKLYNKGNEKSFYKDMDALIDRGFIRCVSSGKISRTKSVYQFSHKWQDYGTDRFHILPNERTMSRKGRT
ncbi:MAG: hypothetical protein PHG06_17720 [Parabacteroides sp.]|nr:hypothetical protein [Parabacteroides sp.]